MSFNGRFVDLLMDAAEFNDVGILTGFVMSEVVSDSLSERVRGDEA